MTTINIASIIHLIVTVSNLSKLLRRLSETACSSPCLAVFSARVSSDRVVQLRLSHTNYHWAILTSFVCSLRTCVSKFPVWLGEKRWWVDTAFSSSILRWSSSCTSIVLRRASSSRSSWWTALGRQHRVPAWLDTPIHILRLLLLLSLATRYNDGMEVRTCAVIAASCIQWTWRFFSRLA